MSPQKPPQRNPRFAMIDWNEISKRGLLERINREIMFPIGLAVYREPATGSSGGALVAPDGVWQYVDEAHPLSDATILAHLETVTDIHGMDIRDELDRAIVKTAVVEVVRAIACQLSASKGSIASALEKRYPAQQSATTEPASNVLCPDCGGTGDIQDQVGKWLGSCQRCADADLLAALEETAKNCPSFESSLPKPSHFDGHFSTAYLTQQQDELYSLLAPDSILRLVALAKASQTAETDRLNAARYLKLRRWMSSNVPDGWDKVEQLGAVGAWLSWADFDQMLDDLPECNVGQCAASTVAADEKEQSC